MKTNNNENETGEAPLVMVKDLSFSYGDFKALESINLDVPAGIVLGIVGPNGGGKTTLIKIMLGLLKGYSGEVKVRCTFQPEGKKIRHRCMGYVPQKSAIDLKFPATVYDTVEMGLYGETGLMGPSKDEKEYVAWLLKETGVEELKNKHIGEISGGQLQRTLIARALVGKPAVIFLDEPLVGVDQTGIAQFVELLMKLKNALNLTVVMVSHALHPLPLCADRVACLNRTLHFHDNPEHLTTEDLTRMYACGFEAYKETRQKRINSQVKTNA
jgi:zinc transport system ATP-binding protein